jgi:hypothetical protein
MEVVALCVLRNACAASAFNQPAVEVDIRVEAAVNSLKK